jgi:hypothetical protein
MRLSLMKAARGRVQCSVPEIRAGSRPLSSVIVLELSASDLGSDDGRVLTDGLKFVPALIDHEGVVRSKRRASRGRRGNVGESALAIIIIHRICARCGPGTDIAI